MSLFGVVSRRCGKLILAASIASYTLGAMAAEDGWHTGQLLHHSSVRREAVQGYGKANGPVVSVLEVDDGSQLYFMQCTAWMDWSKLPSLKDQTSLRFRVSGRKAYIKDDRGVSFRLKIERIETKTSSNQ